MAQIKDIAKKLEQLAPLHYQESYDNSGLQVGDAETEVKGVLLSIDCTEAVLDEAKAKGCNLVVTHHPLIFRGLKRLTGQNHVERCVLKAIKNDIAIYACHTNLDKMANGVSHKLAEKLGLKNPQPLDGDENAGLGCIGELEATENAATFLQRVKQTLGLGCIRHTALPEEGVKKVAVCGGAGQEFLGLAADKGADIYLTADIKYHEFFDADGRIALADIGHYESEQFTKEIFFDAIYEKNSNFAIQYSEIKTNPINYL